MSRTEVFQHRQAFTEVCLNRCFDNLTGWLGHQTTHAGQLSNLLDTATSTRVRHQEHWVDVPSTFTDIILHGVHHVLGDRFPCIGPFVQHMVVSLLTAHQTAVIVLSELHDFLLSVLDEGSFRIGRHQVIRGERKTTSSRFTETHLHHVIEQINRCSTSQSLVAITDGSCQVTTPHGPVIEVHTIGKHRIESNTPRSRIDDCSVDT